MPVGHSIIQSIDESLLAYWKSQGILFGLESVTLSFTKIVTREGRFSALRVRELLFCVGDFGISYGRHRHTLLTKCRVVL